MKVVFESRLLPSAITAHVCPIFCCAQLCAIRSQHRYRLVPRNNVKHIEVVSSISSKWVISSVDLPLHYVGYRRQPLFTSLTLRHSLLHSFYYKSIHCLRPSDISRRFAIERSSPLPTPLSRAKLCVASFTTRDDGVPSQILRCLLIFC